MDKTAYEFMNIYKISTWLGIVMILSACNIASQENTLPQPMDATIVGADANGNGVRDDLDIYIDALPDTSAQKSALTQMAASLGKAMLTDATNQAIVLKASQEIAAAAACLYARYDSTTAGKKSASMEKLTINTTVRFNAYDKFNTALNGLTFTLPQGDGCAS